MPFPKPQAGESKDNFMSRCMGDETMLQEYEDEDQRYAVCDSLWEKEESSMPSRNVMPPERRFVKPQEVRVESGEAGSKLIGKYGIVYDEWSEDLGGFIERVLPGAADESIANDDIRSLVNHDPNLILGRNKAGTLRLDSDERGIAYEVDLPDTSYAKDLVESVRRGDITGNSFGFYVIEDRWGRIDGKDARDLVKIQVFDIGPVTFPAYPQTSVGIRSAWLKAMTSGRILDSVLEKAGIDIDRLAEAMRRDEDMTDEDKAIIAQAIELLSKYLPEVEQEPTEVAEEEAQADLDILRKRLELVGKL